LKYFELGDGADTPISFLEHKLDVFSNRNLLIADHAFFFEEIEIYLKFDEFEIYPLYFSTRPHQLFTQKDFNLILPRMFFSAVFLRCQSKYHDRINVR
jgi:hypothetical protein